VPHAILRWRGAKPRSNLQALARQARYDLLLRRCRRLKVPVLLLAHHADDQAETLLLRLGRGSGLDGLAGMAPAVARDGIVLARPLLRWPKAALIATLRAAGQKWMEDPSNRDPRHVRVRVRQALALLAPDDVVPARIAAAAGQIAQAAGFLNALAVRWADTALPLAPGLWCQLDPMVLTTVPAELGQRSVRLRLRQIGGLAVSPDQAELARFIAALAAGEPATLHRCRALRWRGGLALCRESRFLPTPVPPGRQIWDGRFRLSGGGRSARIAPLGAGWTVVRGLVDTALPAAAAQTLPALWQGAVVVAVPALGFRRPGAPRFAAEPLAQPVVNTPTRII
jgi:tRNA(Ile)-lysidine synthase